MRRLALPVARLGSGLIADGRVGNTSDWANVGVFEIHGGVFILVCSLVTDVFRRRVEQCGVMILPFRRLRVLAQFVELDGVCFFLGLKIVRVQ